MSFEIDVVNAMSWRADVVASRVSVWVSAWLETWGEHDPAGKQPDQGGVPVA